MKLIRDQFIQLECKLDKMPRQQNDHFTSSETEEGAMFLIESVITFKFLVMDLRKQSPGMSLATEK